MSVIDVNSIDLVEVIAVGSTDGPDKIHWDVNSAKTARHDYIDVFDRFGNKLYALKHKQDGVYTRDF